MAAKITYKPSYQGTSELMNGPEMQEMLRQVALKGMAYAQSIAPVRKEEWQTPTHPGGEYKASFEVQVRSHGGVHGDRAEAKIVNTSPHAARVEWEDRYHTLNRTAEQLGSL